MTLISKANRVPPKLKAIHLDEDAAAPFSPEAGVVVVRELAKYFLYMRGQIPGIFDDLCVQFQVKQLTLVRVQLASSERPSSGLEASYCLWWSKPSDVGLTLQLTCLSLQAEESRRRGCKAELVQWSRTVTHPFVGIRSFLIATALSL